MRSKACLHRYCMERQEIVLISTKAMSATVGFLLLWLTLLKKMWLWNELFRKTKVLTMASILELLDSDFTGKTAQKLVKTLFDHFQGLDLGLR